MLAFCVYSWLTFNNVCLFALTAIAHLARTLLEYQKRLAPACTHTHTHTLPLDFYATSYTDYGNSSSTFWIDESERAEKCRKTFKEKKENANVRREKVTERKREREHGRRETE